MRLRSQLVIATVLLTGALTATSLLVVQRIVRREVHNQAASSAEASVSVLSTVQREREGQLSRTAALLSELPTLKALMSTQDRPTVQDGSKAFWRLSGGDLFILATPDGNLLAKHFVAQAWPDKPTVEQLRDALSAGVSSAWWFYDGHLYWVFLHPLRSGMGEDTRDLGVVVLGYEADHRLAQELSEASKSRVAILADGQLIATTLEYPGASRFNQLIATLQPSPLPQFGIGNEEYLADSVLLQNAGPQVVCRVLVPLAASRAFLSRMDRTILMIGASALGIGGILFSVIAGVLTRPLDNVVAGMRALSAGDYERKLDARGSMETEHLALSFASMRRRLLWSHRDKMAAQRVAALGQAASSTSHDLRHYLVALVANAEFLYEAESLRLDRDEIYGEIKTATDQMLDLIDTLRELALEGSTMKVADSELRRCIRRAIDAVHVRPGCRDCQIALNANDNLSGKFDPMKIERAFFNLILNACEAASVGEGHVRVECTCDEVDFTILVSDNGMGISEDIRHTLFDPFVSSGKREGTGLGLSIAQTILRDHRGTISLEETGAQGTTMKVCMPRYYQPVHELADNIQGILYEGGGS